jgi:Subtilisin inhibitor-like
MTHEKLTARRLAAAGAAIAGLALTACGSVAAPSGSGGSGAGGSGAAASSPAAAPKASLTITVLNGPDKKISHWTLQCDPAGGTHPDAAQACAALLAVKNPFAPIRTGQECPMILASSRRVTFVGTWYGTKVDRTIIDGGCDLANWSRLGQVVN